MKIDLKIEEGFTLKKCFVVMGFGEKMDYITGNTVDLDIVYNDVIKPLMEKEFPEYEVIRGERHNFNQLSKSNSTCRSFSKGITSSMRLPANSSLVFSFVHIRYPTGTAK